MGGPEGTGEESRPACRVTDEVASCAIGMAAIDGKKILDQRERLTVSQANIKRRYGTNKKADFLRTVDSQ